jgi:hypothetical protein
MKKEITGKKGMLVIANILMLGAISGYAYMFILYIVNKSNIGFILVLGSGVLSFLIMGVVYAGYECFKITLLDDRIICQHIFRKREILYSKIKKISLYGWRLNIKYGSIISGKSTLIRMLDDELVEFIKALNDKLPSEVRKIKYL